MSQALYRKYRPRRWEEVVAQGHVVGTLRNAVASDRVAHAYLFAGPRGTGKTSVARLLAKAVNCLNEDLAARPDDECEYCRAVDEGRFLDLIEIDAASNTSVDDVRDLRDKINFAPNQGRYKVYIVDEVHMLSTAAFNALLKTLEEPPPHAIFVLATTEAHKIPATVLSRCQRHEFRRIPTADIVSHLEAMVAGEGLEVEPQALQLLARQATGSLRDAISLLDQLSAGEEVITLRTAQAVLGVATSQAVLDLVNALQAEDAAAGLDLIHRTLDGGSDPRQFARQIVDYLRGVLLVRMGNAARVDTTAEVRAHMAQHAQAFEVPDLLRFIKAFNQAAGEARLAWQPGLPLEMAFVESLEGAASQPAANPAGGSAAPAASAPSEDPPPRAAPPAKSESQASRKAWSRFLGAVKDANPNTHALLKSCRVHELRGGALYLGFASDVLKRKMEAGESLALVQGAASEAFGRSVEVRCFVANVKGEIPPEVDSTGMVATALRLGGEIVDTNDLGQNPPGE